MPAAIAERLHVRQRGKRAAVELGQGAELSGLDQRKAGSHAVDDIIDRTGQEALHHLRAALVGHQLDVDAGLPVEQIARQPGGDDAGAVVQLAGLALAPAISSADGLGPALGPHRQERGVLGRQGDGREVPERIIGEIADGGRVHHQGGVHRGQERVAVRGGAGDLLGADHRVGAGPVLDHDRLPPILAHALGDHAREDVGRAAGRERHDDADRPAGKWLGGCRRLSCGGHRQQPWASRPPRADGENGRFIGNLPPMQAEPDPDTRHCGVAGNRFRALAGRTGLGIRRGRHFNQPRPWAKMSLPPAINCRK